MTLIAVINLTFSSVVLVTHINLKIYTEIFHKLHVTYVTKSITKTNKILYKLPYVTKNIMKTNKILYKLPMLPKAL